MDNMDNIEVRIPDEIRDYQEKYGGFTVRNWIGILLTLILVVPIYYTLQKTIINFVAIFITMLVASPIVLIFFIPIHGMNIEKIFPYIKRNFLDYATVLEFKTENEILLEQAMMKDKRYKKQIKAIKKLEKKRQLKIERGDIFEESDKLQSMRKDVNAYYNLARKEKMQQIIDSKKPLSKAQKRELVHQTKQLKKEKKQKNKEQAQEIQKLSEEIEKEKELQEQQEIEGKLIDKGNTEQNSVVEDILESNPIIEKEVPRGINEILSTREEMQQNLREDSNKEDKNIERNESVEDVVLDWRAEHPQGTIAECFKETGISRNDIRRCWNL